MAEPEEDHGEETNGTHSGTEESDSESCSSSSESDGEILVQAASLAKETKGGTSMKDIKMGNPNSSQVPSLPDANNKDTEEEEKVQQCKDAWLLDKNFSVWHDQMISKGHADWKKCDTMTCNHADPCKEFKILGSSRSTLGLHETAWSLQGQENE